MKDKYFKNRNKKKSYTLEELINSGPIFNNDLIWTKGLSDWTKASNIDELKEYVLESPPERKSKILLKKIMQSILLSLIVLILLSFIVGITAGFLEKNQYYAFIEKVQPNIDEYFKKKQEQAELERRNQEVNKRKISQINQRIINLHEKFSKKDKELESLQNAAYNNWINSSNSNQIDFYSSLSKGFLEKRKKLLKNHLTKNLLLFS